MRGRIHILVGAFLFLTQSIFAQSTAFTYQGKLNTSGTPANGIYDLRFTIYDAVTNGSSLGVITNGSTSVSNGLFTVNLDFGSSPFTTGASRWLEIGVRTNGGGLFTTLSSRQQIAPTPYAIYTPNAGAAVVAASANSVAAGNISGTLAVSQLPTVVVTNNATGVTLNGSFIGNGGGLTNIPLVGINSYGSLFPVTNGANFAVSATPNVNGAGPTDAAIADVNGDGRMDLISANYAGNTVTVVTNNGSSFGPYSTNTVGASPFYVFTTDINADGRPDLVTANYGNNTLTVLTNNGVGFGLFASPAVSTNPAAATAADVNADGRMDLISVDYGASRLTLLINNGNATFLSIPLAVGPFPYFVVPGDVNGDGKPDLVSANSGNSSLSVLTNDGTGTFSSNATITATIAGPLWLAAGDVNGDGKLDLVSANGNNTLGIVTNNSSGIFGSNAVVNLSFYPSAVDIRDMDSDGRPDLIVAGVNNELAIFANRGVNGFVLSGLLHIGAQHYGIETGDVTGDGRPDVILPNYVGTGTLSIVTNGSGGLTTEMGATGRGGLRVLSGLTDSPDVLNGSAANLIDFNVSGAVIAGGGTTNFLGQYSINHVSSDYSTISGGSGNTIQVGSDHATIGGGWKNVVGNSSYQSVIAGGERNVIGDSAPRSFIGGGLNNTNLSQYGVIGGGYQNIIQPGSAATIGGGTLNSVQANAYESTIAGGKLNYIGTNVNHSTIAGGYGNTNLSLYSSIGGGLNNYVNGAQAVVAGGQGNIASNANVTIGGGGQNVATGLTATIAGGFQNSALNTDAVVAGGYSNVVTGYRGTISGGAVNTASGAWSVIGGAQGNSAESQFATVSGGQNNTNLCAQGFIAGGYQNIIMSGNASSLGGGYQNVILTNAYEAVIAGGWTNFIGNGAAQSTISGGSHNVIGDGVNQGVIGGGAVNIVTDDYATVPGGAFNTAGGESSFAAGHRAKALHKGAFVWADATEADFSSANSNQFLVRASFVGVNRSTPVSGADCFAVESPVTSGFGGMHLNIAGATARPFYGYSLAGTVKGYHFIDGSDSNKWKLNVNGDRLTVTTNGNVGIGNTNPTNLLMVSSAYCTGTSWVNASDRNLKENFAAVDGREVLEKVARLPISEWNYKTEASARHLGPIAQDFKEAFDLGNDDRSISTIDEGGVALAAIQGLNQKLEEKLSAQSEESKRKDAEIQLLKTVNASLEKRLEQLEKVVGKLAK